MGASRVLLGVVAVAVLLAISGGVYASSLGASNGPSGGSRGPTYNVTFHESGLATGTYWSVSIFGHGGGWRTFHGRGLVSNGSSITVSLPNGTYRYRVHGVPGYEILAGAQGNFTVNGSAPPPLDVTFATPASYTVTFTETGLPAGTNWTVRVVPIGRGPTWYAWFGWHRYAQFAQRTSSPSVTFSLPNGTYRFQISEVRGFTIADNGSRGTFNVSGAPVTIPVVFRTPVKYTVTFSESGLAAGTNWTVRLFGGGGGSWSSGGIHVVRANTTSITFSLTNGTYYFHVRAYGYTATNNSSGTVVVAGGSPPTIEVTFAPYVHDGAPPWVPVSSLTSAAT